MRLLDLVEEDHLVGPPPHRLGQDTAFVVADIARRRPDEPRDGVLLHEFRHVDADHRLVVVEEVFRDGLGQLGLADARRSEEEERAQRPVFVVQTGPRAADGIRDGLHRRRLADDPLAEFLLHAQELLALAFQHLGGRNAGPALDHLGDLLRAHGFLDHQVVVALLGLSEAPLQVGDDAVAELARSGQVALALGDVELRLGVVQLFLQLAGGVQLVALGLPLGGHFVGPLLQFRELLLDPLEPVAGGLVVLLPERLDLDLRLQDLAIERVELLGLGIDFHPQARGRLVHEVDRLVGQEPVGDVAVAELGGGHEGAVGDPHAVVQFVLLLDAAQDRDRVLDRRLLDHQRLEPPRQRRVLLHVLAVLVERGRTDAVQLAAGQRGLEEVRGVHRPVSLAGADQGVHLVDEEDDLSRGGLDLLQDRLQPLLELAPVLRAGDERAHVERQKPLVLETLRHVSVDDAERQALGDGRLADAGLADQDGVVLGPPGKDLHGAPDLVVPADDRVDLAFARTLRQVDGEFLQGLVALLRGGAVGRAALPQVVDRGVQALRVHRARIERVLRLRLDDGERGQQPLDGHEAVAGLLRELLRLVHDAAGLLVEIDLCAFARDLGLLGEGQLELFGDALRLAAGAGDEVCGEPLLVVEERLQQVLRHEALVVLAHGDRLCGLNEAARPFGEFLQVHDLSLLSSTPSVRPVRRGTAEPSLKKMGVAEMPIKMWGLPFATPSPSGPREMGRQG